MIYVRRKGNGKNKEKGEGAGKGVVKEEENFPSPFNHYISWIEGWIDGLWQRFAGLGRQSTIYHGSEVNMWGKVSLPLFTGYIIFFMRITEN